MPPQVQPPLAHRPPAQYHAAMGAGAREVERVLLPPPHRWVAGISGLWYDPRHRR